MAHAIPIACFTTSLASHAFANCSARHSYVPPAPHPPSLRCVQMLQNLHTYLTFLQDQELLHNEGTVWSRGKRLFHVSDIGHTLEWYVAEWFRLTETCRSHHVIPVRHGVTFHRSLDVGDIDVVALLDSSWTVTLECKSSSHITANELALFLKRATLLQPAIAVLVIDTPTLSPDGHIRRLNALLAKNGEEPLLPVASAEGMYWGAKHMCVTCVSQSLPSALEAVLQVIEQNMSPFTQE